MHKFKKLVSKKVDGENYYSIHYLDETDGEIHIGLSSSNLDVISDFLKEFFINNNTEQHAHWKQVSCGLFQCSNCKEKFMLIGRRFGENVYNYCPCCGYKMDEVTNNFNEIKE